MSLSEVQLMKQEEPRLRLLLQQAPLPSPLAGASEEVEDRQGRVRGKKPQERQSPVALHSEEPRAPGRDGCVSHSQEDCGHLVDSDP